MRLGMRYLKDVLKLRFPELRARAAAAAAATAEREVMHGFIALILKMHRHYVVEVHG